MDFLPREIGSTFRDMTVTDTHFFRSRDPWENLAREELLLDHLGTGGSALVFYINSPCVVLGKHQNPLREVRLAEAARRSVPVVRRVSGGGTVWHDEGNLNWSLLLPKDGYDRNQVSQTVVLALGTLGFRAGIGEKGDLHLGGKKISGAAYLVRRDRVLHHGTLLCRANLRDLHGILGPTGSLVEWVGVPSRPMEVTNLGIDPSEAAEALVRTIAGSGAAVGTGVGDREFETSVAARAGNLRSAGWVWDQTPPFTWEGETRVGRILARVKVGLVEEISGGDDINVNMSKMVGKRFFTPDLFDYIPSQEVP